MPTPFYFLVYNGISLAILVFRPGIIFTRGIIFMDKLLLHKIELHGLELEELKRLVTQLGEPGYRATQLFHWIHAHQVGEWERMTNLPRGFREKLKEVGCLPEFSYLRQWQDPVDGTTKLLLNLRDGEKIECVLMKHEREGKVSRYTACVSSQVGCALGCGFCATGKFGFRRNLTAGEIVGQVWALQRYLGPREGGKRIGNVVFMGMGEPLLNYEAVLKARRILMDPDGWGISHRRITLSTCGLVPEIKRLAGEEPPVELAVSLHATTDEIRNKLVPINRRYPLKELLRACRYYVEKTNRRITFEYILIKGINDTMQDAERLAGMARGILAYINLWPFNPIPGSFWEPPPRKHVQDFALRLKERGVEVAIRESRGIRIAAACGQLRYYPAEEV